MHCVLCMLCLFVDTVNTKIKTHNALNAMFVDCQHWCLWLLHNTVYRVMRCENSTMYLKFEKLCMLYMSTQSMQNTSTYFCHNFLNI